MRIRNFSIISLSLILGITHVLPALAQEIPTDPTSRLEETQKRAEEATGETTAKVREANIDLSVPTSPAFTVLGVTPNNVIRPASPREFGVAILNGADPNGNFQTGLALEFSPYLLGWGNDLTLKEYQGNPLKRFLARTQVSLATTKGTNDDDKSTRIALGFSLTPWDEGDPRANEKLFECFTGEGANDRFAQARETLDEITPFILQNPNISPEDAEKIIQTNKLEKEFSKHFADCRKKNGGEPEDNWNSSSLSLGVAPTWLSSSGETKDLQWSGAALWTSLALGFGFNDPGFENFGQIILHGRYRGKEQFPNPVVDGGLIEQDTWLVAGQARITGWDFKNFMGVDRTGGPDFNFQFDVSYRNEERMGVNDEEIFRYTAGAEMKITDGLFLNLSIGAEEGGGPGQDQGFTLANLKWAFSEEPSFTNTTR